MTTRLYTALMSIVFLYALNAFGMQKPHKHGLDLYAEKMAKSWLVLTACEQELKLACYVFEQEHKSLIILINKEDLIDEQTRKDLEHDMTQYNFILKHVPILYISCKTGKNIGKIVPAVDELYQRSIAQFSDAELTQLFKHELEKRHLFYQEQELTLQKAKQIKSNPMIITLFVNWPEAFGPSQLAFFENILRAQYDLKGVPVKMVPRKR